MVEIWKDILNYETIYQISNFGNIRLYKSKKILKPSDDGKGYLHITLTKNGKRKGFRIHRLVAQTFIPNINNLPQINHKDENKKNNNVNNLEWCDSKYNNNYGTRNYRCTRHRIKKVNQFNYNNILINTYNSIGEAELKTGIKYQGISACCRSIQKSAGGYIWKYC